MQTRGVWVAKYNTYYSESELLGRLQTPKSSSSIRNLIWLRAPSFANESGLASFRYFYNLHGSVRVTELGYADPIDLHNWATGFHHV